MEKIKIRTYYFNDVQMSKSVYFQLNKLSYPGGLTWILLIHIMTGCELHPLHEMLIFNFSLFFEKKNN